MTVQGNTLTPHQADVYSAMKDWSRAIPDHALVPLVQHVAGHHISSSGVRTRRSELEALGLVREVPSAAVKLPSGRKARAFKVVG